MARPIRPFFLNSMDPGRDTGLSLFLIQPDAYTLMDHRVIRYDPEYMSSPTTVLMEWLEMYTTHPHMFVYENFHVRPQEAIPDTTALNVIGAVHEWMMRRPVVPYQQVIKQEPVQGKHMATDEVLVRAGLYVDIDADSRHVRDANRHAVKYLDHIKHRPLHLAGWPPPSVRSSA